MKRKGFGKHTRILYKTSKEFYQRSTKSVTSLSVSRALDKQKHYCNFNVPTQSPTAKQYNEADTNQTMQVRQLKCSVLCFIRKNSLVRMNDRIWAIRLELKSVNLNSVA